ncbi:hypothetical protein [Streptomyces sp. MB09-02B]|uniref:hypothetical protein n=1 Tax=Streptomyces sp. MB09-02B TaxID=3028667 RepID=UPI0029AF7F1F|nr:hypothetical protein [Streptomyces sp. MB09-02B]MDX3645317.1 hypothetical protein [Streptomyces sp. MB09-02B]
MQNKTITIRNIEDAVATIAAYATRVIAAGNHPGHNLEEVGARMTRDEVLDTIRASLTRRISNGATAKEAIIGTGQAVIAHYCNAAGI